MFGLGYDTLVRYAPMAEALASGNWCEAFHPRFGIGMPLCAGSISFATGLDGLDACAVASILALVLSAIPFYRIVNRLAGRPAAIIGTVLFLACPQTLIWGVRGLREPFKLLGLLLVADGILEAYRARAFGRHAGFPSVVLGVLALCLFKVDGIAFAVALGILYAFFDKFSLRSWAVAGIAVLAVQPQCYLVWRWTGWWVPGIQFISMAGRMFGCLSL